jgi:LysM repeat protein
MLKRYRGRHRRPANRSLGLATGSTVAMTALAGASVALAAPASAASVSTWDRLAQCESSGNWSINTGNGYYGGLQFSLQSWQWVGGSGYPHQASKSEQIRRAEILLDRQGWNAWPACSRKLGLTAADAGGSPAVSAPAERADRSASRPAAPTAAPAASGSQYAVRAGDTLASIARAHGTSWQSLYAANQAVIGSNPNRIYIGQVLSVGSAPAKAAPATSTASGGSYTVQRGDTLASIARDLGTSWQSLYAANKGVIGSNPNLIYPGQSLAV